MNERSDRFVVHTNPDGWFLDYDALVLTLDKRWSGSWQGKLSYTLSRADGLQSASTRRIGGPQESRNFGRGDPNQEINAEGRLTDDRTHVLRAQAVAEIPKLGVLLGANLQFLTGKPWAASTFVSLPQGGVNILLEPMGTRRLPSQTLLDLRFSKVFEVGERGRLEFSLDVLNALDDRTALWVRGTDPFRPDFGELGGFNPWPRRLLLGAKVAF